MSKELFLMYILYILLVHYSDKCHIYLVFIHTFILIKLFKISLCTSPELDLLVTMNEEIEFVGHLNISIYVLKMF